MKALNKQTAPKSVAPERIIQFGEGNFLRAFVDWIVYNMNQKTDFNSSVVVVQPIERGMAEWLNGQDCLYLPTYTSTKPKKLPQKPEKPYLMPLQASLM